MTVNKKKHMPFMNWIFHVAEEKIVEHRLLEKEFNSHKEFIIFTIIWMRVYKKMYQSIEADDSNLSLDDFVKNFYDNQKDKFLGITINAITRESNIPRSTVKRIIEDLIKKNLVSRNSNSLIIPTSKVREVMNDYRKFIYKSHLKLSKIFEDSNLKINYQTDDEI
jgi:predicted transcriptional regulator